MISSILTWEDIFKFIKRHKSVTISQINDRFKHNQSNIPRKIHCLVKHRKIRREGDRLVPC